MEQLEKERVEQQLLEEKRVEEEKQKIKAEEERKLKIEEEENQKLQAVQRRIREVEESIAALDWELERNEIAKMKVKTKNVIKRISQIVEDDDTDISKDIPE